MNVSPEFREAVRKELKRQRRLARATEAPPVFGAGGQQGKDLRSLGQEASQIRKQLEAMEQRVTALKNKARQVTRSVVKDDKKLGMELAKASVELDNAIQGVGEAGDALYKADNIIGSVSVKYHG